MESKFKYEIIFTILDYFYWEIYIWSRWVSGEYITLEFFNKLCLFLKIITGKACISFNKKDYRGALAYYKKALPD